MEDVILHSPGFDVKYGTYSLMNAYTNEIVDCCIVHFDVAGSSVRMGKMGLCTLLEKCRDKAVSIRSLRHVQITSYVAKGQPDITHHFDICQVGKIIKKALFQASKLTSCEEMKP